MGNAIAGMIAAADNYQKAHFALYAERVADDGLLGPALLDVLLGTRELLKGEVGNHKGEILDRELTRVALDAGYVEIP